MFLKFDSSRLIPFCSDKSLLIEISFPNKEHLFKFRLNFFYVYVKMFLWVQ